MMNNFFEGKRIVVTGGAGFLGKYVVTGLKKRGCKNVFTPRSKYFDFTNNTCVRRMYKDFQPDVVIHLAAKCGGIGANQKYPGSFFYDNAIMGMQLLEEGRRWGVPKFVTVGTVCSYPKHCPVPFKEEDIWNGYPEETNAPYGLAKKMLLVQSQAYRQQYAFNSIYLIPVNLYGPGDNYDLASSHVIPALIKKCVHAQEIGDSTVCCWGSGNVSREFIYVEDAAEGILKATELYSGAEPVNIGSGCDITIKQLVHKIARFTGYTGDFVWNTVKPDGQPKRKLDVTRAKELFGFEATTSLDVGLVRMIDAYKGRCDE